MTATRIGGGRVRRRPPRPGPSRGLAVRLARRPLFVVGALVLVGWAAVAAGWEALAPYTVNDQTGRPLSAPDADHLLGTDLLGQDVLTRVLAGAEPVLVVAPLATLLGVGAGTLLGLWAGYRRGWVDEVLSRGFDAVIVFPSLLLAVLAVSMIGASTGLLVVVIGVGATPLVARVVRGAVLVERERQYVEAARLRGERGWYIALVEILPNVAGVVVVEATVRLGFSVFTAATLSFLGLGAEVGSPDWGAQVSANRVVIQSAWWAVVFPAAAIASLVVAVTLIADTLRQELDA